MSKRIFFVFALSALIFVVSAAEMEHDHSDHSMEGHDGHDHDHSEHSMEGHDEHKHEHEHEGVPLCADGCPEECECMGGKYCGLSSGTGGIHDKHLACKMPEESDEPEDPVCFPADAQVTLPDGIKAISDLEIGDRVLVGDGQFSEVVMFTHRDAMYKGTYVELITESNTIQLTRGHYIYANGNLVPSETVKIGDMLTLADGSNSAVTAIREAMNTGLYNPQTAHGDIVVGGVVASTYTTFVKPSAAHTLLAPVRALFQAGGVTALDSFSGLFGTVSA